MLGPTEEELAEAEVVRFAKVHGTSNPANLMTKYLAGPRSAELASALAQRPREGHAGVKSASEGIFRILYII